MNTWGQDLTGVAATGVVTQLFPPYATVGTSGDAYAERRKAKDGVLYRIDIFPEAGSGGILELFDVAGTWYGASNNVNTGDSLTDAYVDAAISAGKGRLIWRIGFDGDEGPATKTFATRVPFMYGLAARFVKPDSVTETVTVRLNIVAEGAFQKVFGGVPS